MARLDGKFCIITGAASGIGRAIAHAFIAEGARVLITDMDEAAGAAVANELGAAFLKLDVAEERDWARLAELHPRVDVLVNNAGVIGGQPGNPEEMALDAWRTVHRINLDGTFLGCRYAIGAMKAAGAGSIINMSSRAGLSGVPHAIAYASSKAGIANLTKSVALYCAEKGWAIRCNSVHPGSVLTPIWDAMLGHGPDRGDRIKAITADTPLNRFGAPEEVAALCVLLASDEATFITGSAFNIDGGLSAGPVRRG